MVCRLVLPRKGQDATGSSRQAEGGQAVPRTAAETTSAQAGREADFYLVGFYSYFLSWRGGGRARRTRGERWVGWAGAELEHLVAREGKIVIKFRIKALTPILNVRTMAEISRPPREHKLQTTAARALSTGAPGDMQATWV